MDNIYYYVFYLIVKMIKRLNSRHDFPNFSGALFLSTLIFFNFLSLLIPIASSLIHPSNIFFICITVMIIVVIPNYYLLMNEEKSQRIITFFDEKFKNEKRNKTKIALIVLYIILTYVLMIYVFTLKRNNQI